MSRITDTRFGDRLVTVELDAGVYTIWVQAEGEEKVTSKVFVSQEPIAVIAAQAAIGQTLELLHRAGDQSPGLPLSGPGHFGYIPHCPSCNSVVALTKQYLCSSCDLFWTPQQVSDAEKRDQ